MAWAMLGGVIGTSSKTRGTPGYVIGYGPHQGIFQETRTRQMWVQRIDRWVEKFSAGGLGVARAQKNWGDGKWAPLTIGKTKRSFAAGLWLSERAGRQAPAHLAWLEVVVPPRVRPLFFCGA